MFGPHVVRGRVEEEYASVAHGHLIVTDPGVAEAADHHLVAAIQENFTVHAGLPFQVTPNSDLYRTTKERFAFMHTHRGACGEF